MLIDQVPEELHLSTGGDEARHSVYIESTSTSIEPLVVRGLKVRDLQI